MACESELLFRGGEKQLLGVVPKTSSALLTRFWPFRRGGGALEGVQSKRRAFGSVYMRKQTAVTHEEVDHVATTLSGFMLPLEECRWLY